MEGSSFEEFYEQEYHAVLAYARVMVGDRYGAEDVTQDAFSAALGSWEDLENPSAWIRTVVANKSRSSLRRRYAERRATERLDPVVVGSEIPEETESFWAHVRALPQRQSQAIALFYLEDRSVADIALVLGCSESTARVHLTRGRRALAKRLGGDV
ncbi:MAG: sigma-70 family RNA polymerase sigma factor [Acidimicrobiia bacterium]|nr:sigma-70 family RNA polymerase sigma factor [Acidimicrobiia bacterium]